MNTSRAGDVAPMAWEETRSFPAGAVTFTVVHREFTEAAMLKYEGRPGVAELLAKIRKEGFYDAGVSIYVNDTETNRDFLRFDCLEREPHYHYHRLDDAESPDAPTEMDTQRIAGHADSVVRNGYWHQVPFDSAANGDMRGWAVDRIRRRLPEMLRQAGADELADQVDQQAVAAAVDSFEPLLFVQPTP